MERTLMHVCIYIYVSERITFFYSIVCFHLPHLGSLQQPGAQVSILSDCYILVSPVPTSLLAYTFETCQVSELEAMNKTRQDKTRQDKTRQGKARIGVIAAAVAAAAVAVGVVVVVA